MIFTVLSMQTTDTSQQLRAPVPQGTPRTLSAEAEALSTQRMLGLPRGYASFAPSMRLKARPWQYMVARQRSVPQRVFVNPGMWPVQTSRRDC